MIKEVDLASYLPPFIAELKEIRTALDAENPEFALVWKAADQTLKNEFIATADEYGIARFEKILNILPSTEDTLESRRSRCQSKWFDRIPYTLRILLQKLMALCGDMNFTITNNFTGGYTLMLDTNLELYGQVEELEHIIDEVVPCNIVVFTTNNIHCATDGQVYAGGCITYTDIIEIEN